MRIGHKEKKTEPVPLVQVKHNGEWLYFNSIYHQVIPKNGRNYTGDLRYVFCRQEKDAVQPMFLWSAEGIVKLLTKLGFKARLKHRERNDDNKRRRTSKDNSNISLPSEG